MVVVDEGGATDVGEVVATEVAPASTWSDGGTESGKCVRGPVVVDVV
jgi:hypothetical protein